MFPHSVFQEKHAEGERLRKALQGDEVEGFREENLCTLGEEVLLERQEVEELRARAKALETRSKEMMLELEEAQQEKEKAEEKRKEAEKQWSSKVEEMEEEQEHKLKALLVHIQNLKDNEGGERSGKEKVDKKVGESHAEFSSMNRQKRRGRRKPETIDEKQEEEVSTRPSHFPETTVEKTNHRKHMMFTCS